MEQKKIERVDETRLNDIKAYIAEQYIPPVSEPVYAARVLSNSSFESRAKKKMSGSRTFSTVKEIVPEAYEIADEGSSCCFGAPFSQEELEALVEKPEESFADMMFRLIGEKGMTEPQVYKRANLDRKHFGKIKNSPAYKPGKAAALSLAIALELEPEELKRFIGKADHQLSHCFKPDIVIEYCVDHHIYDIDQINGILYELDLPMLSEYR